MHKLSRLFSNCHFEFFLFNWLAFFSCGQIHLSISRRIWPVPQGYGWASHVIKITLKVGHRGLMVMALECGTKGPGFKSQPQILFFGKFSKKKGKKQRNKMLRRILQIYSNIAQVEYRTTIRPTIWPQVMDEYWAFFQYRDQVKLFVKASCHLKDNRLPLTDPRFG